MPEIMQHVLLTRSPSNNEYLRSELVDSGYTVSELQLITMHAVESAQTALKRLLNSHSYSGIIFVSPAAADFGLQLLSLDELKGTQFYAVGQGTADAMLKNNNDIESIIYPSNSAGADALLALPELNDLRDRRFLIVTGEEGKPLLAERLLAGRAKADVFECYKRSASINLASDLSTIVSSSQVDNIDHVFLHSAHAAECFLNLWKDQLDNKQQPIAIVGAQSIKDVLIAGGWNARIHIAKSPVNRDMLDIFNE